MSAPRFRSLQATSRKSTRARAKQSRSRRPLLESLEERCLLAASPPLLSTIEGFNIDDNAFNTGATVLEPPDPHGAVGPEHLVNVGNVSIQWFMKDGTRQGHTSLRNFFSQAPPSARPINDLNALLFDPKVVYDQYAERFVVVALEQMNTVTGGTADVARILMAVSDDSDPNGTWYYKSITGMVNQTDPADPTLTLAYWTDYPGLAVDEEAIYITGSLLSFAGDTANGNRLWIVDKGFGTGGFYDNGPARVNVYNPGLDTLLDFTVRPDYDPAAPQPFRSMTPAHVYGEAPNDVGTWLVMYDGHSNGINEFVDVIRIEDPLGTPEFTLTTVDVGDVDDTSVITIPLMTQRGAAATIDGGDRRIVNAVWRDGSLYATTVVLPDEGPDINQVTTHWFRFDANSNSVTLADQGDVGGEDIGFATNTAWPSLNVDALGNMAITFAGSGPAIYPGAYYAVRAVDDPPGTIRDSVTLAEGLDVYAGARWGDYSSVAVDPTDGVTFWAFNEYSLPEQGQGARWGTRWGEFRLGALPALPEPGPTTITGVKWHDLDEDGFRDVGEPVIANTLIFADLDGDTFLDLGEPTARSNAAGAFSLTINVDGPVAIRETILPGWQQTFPGGTTLAHLLTIPQGGGGTITGVDFGNSNNAGFDYGDAPAPYPTLAVNNGPSHPVVGGISLGLLIDGEPNGQPDIDALGDDNTDLADEDGVQLPTALTPGALATIEVTTTGTGLLQGWVDFNRDGDWNDPGEQIFRDLSLSTGTRALSFAVPAGANPGTSYARFRFGNEGGLGPVGGSNRGGEVEDYRIDILSERPIANDDAFTVEQNSNNNVFLVLANDIPSASGRANMRLDSVATAGSSGTAVIDRSGTPNDWTDDFIRYTPAAGAFAPDSFSYTITDVRSGQSDSAIVSVTIVPFQGSFPVAVDDSYIYTPEGAGQPFDNLNVLANDQRGPTGTISIPANGLDTTTTFGDAQLVTVNGQQQVRYAPNGFSGTDQFRYTIVDGDGTESTATVTIRVAPFSADDIVEFRLVTTDLNGNPISEIGQGMEFQVRAYVDDLRGESGHPPLNNPDYPVTSPAEQGVFSAYMDLLYDAGLIAYGGDTRLAFGQQYPANHFVDSATPGLLNEVGALQGAGSPLGPNEQLLYAATFTATAQGTATFRADPADVLPLHETSMNFPAKAVEYPRIDFGIATINVVEAPTLVTIRLAATDLNGNPLPNNQIQAGSDFLLSAFVQDVRGDVADANKGLFSAYLDVFYPPTMARPVEAPITPTNPSGFAIGFGPLFSEVQKAEFIVSSGIINEVGAVQDGSPEFFADEELLFTTRFTALTPPGGLGSIVFTADPADLQPINEVSLIRAATGQIPDPGLSVSPAQIEYIGTPVITVVSGSGEGEFTNPLNQLDVNGDGYTSPHDALILVNFLNVTGPMDLSTLLGGEGESGERYYYDTNGDKLISPLDVIGVINYLNTSSQEGEGEGEATADQPAIAAQLVDPQAAAMIVAALDAAEAGEAIYGSDSLFQDGMPHWDVTTAAEDEEQIVDALAADDDPDLDRVLVDELLEDISQAWLDAANVDDLLVPLV